MSVADVQRSLYAAQVANDGILSAMLEFQAACMEGDWDRSECARQKAKDMLDAYCDHIAAAHRVQRGR